MPSVWKDIFRPGKYRDHAGEVHTFTPADVISAYKNGRSMLAASIPFPVPAIWEHDWTSVPMPRTKFLSEIAPDRDKRGELAKNTFGWGDGYRLDFERDKATGEVQPVLYAKINSPDSKDLAQLQKVRYVSPRVDWDFRDTLGRTWDGCCVTHIAATSMPVQMNQRPVMLGGPPSSRTLFLGAPMADPKAGDKDKGGAAGGDMSRLKSALTANGLGIPDTAGDLDSICLALETLAMSNTTVDPEPETDEAGDDMGDSNAVGAANSMSPAMLSALPVEARQAVEAGMKAQEKATSVHRASLIKRFKAVQGKAAERGIATAAELSHLERRLTGVSLSFNGEGDLLMNAAIRELSVIENAVKATGGGQKNDGKKKGGPRVGGVDLSSITFGGDAAPQPGTPEFDVLLAKEKERAGQRVAPGSK